VLQLNQFREYRDRVLSVDKGREMIDWARSIQRPGSAEELAESLVGVILSSGFSYETARTFVKPVMDALAVRRPIMNVFPHERKAEAIEYVWEDRRLLLDRLFTVRPGSVEDGFRWCEEIPFIRGPVLRYQAVRDLGLAEVAKPDRLMVRVARKFDEPGENDAEAVQSLCVRLAADSNERVGTVDVILWFAASKGFIDGIILRGRRPPCHGLPLTRKRRSSQPTTPVAAVGDGDEMGCSDAAFVVGGLN
jgi:hypothetical protein